MVHFKNANKEGWVAEFEQRDQMAKLFFQYLAIYNKKICPKSYKLYQSGFTTLPNTKWTLKIWPNISKFLANASKFRQIWSHWVWVTKTGRSSLQIPLRGNFLLYLIWLNLLSYYDYKTILLSRYCFFKCAILGLFFVYFHLFKQTLQS